ncbi:hypothetical protein A3715_16525 [Oleiphilus sp. HI0009]|uniref:DUF4870 family protein n=2 Tax=Oleiphilus TaxID=141450 RepID=UPI0007C3AE1B|nr:MULTISPECIES: hypothetical protein [unclassified Oleiphilus]KZX86207.1 hypothetical protein A3715_16525 [Oleiphilus sp. HI0009]MCH2157340.1 hypothetical protein [Oleiphilaceae bacterium]KZY70023.1 hypothetical protein A3738_04020 [Oleiphilus sp. HI0066]KZY72014.1 hypothetical protein A3739_16175 [Oleiphilus sp. HI0067]KZZ57696.1 hypothetical protein A3762_09265 [Oleiphilus sp. HI0125]
MSNVANVPSGKLEKLVFVAYLLHFFSAFNGLLSPALIVTAFLTGWPSIIALIICYVWRDEAAGTYLDSHFTWLIRTFWFALLCLVVGFILVFTIIGAVIGIPMLLILGLWVLYRLLRGVLRLNARLGMLF